MTGSNTVWLQGVTSGEKYEIGPLFRDPVDGGQLSVTFDLPAVAERFADEWKSAGSMWDRFGAVLTPLDQAHVISLGEGSTPLVRSERIAKRLGLKNLFFKLESCNPTGSFKDRQISVALSMGRSWGRTRYATVSSGNVGNALSAYCAKAGYEAFVWVSDDTAESKRQQISVYGGQLFLVPAPGEGRVRDHWNLFRDLQGFCLARNIVPMISARPVNPFMVEGTKTIAFEIAAELNGVPDEMFCCVGGGGLLGGMHKGFSELVGLGQSPHMPRIHGGQRNDRNYAPIDKVTHRLYVEGDYYLPLDGEWAWSAIQDTGGSLLSVSGDDIAEAQAWLANLEGIFAEPQGAYATAALVRAARNGELDPDATVVCIVTGIGLKDMAATKRFVEFEPQRAAITVTGLADSSL